MYMKEKIKAIVIALLIGLLIGTLISYQAEMSLAQPVQEFVYHSNVCVYKNNELIQCSPNSLTDVGKDYISDLIGAGLSSGDMNLIALSNESTPTSSSTSLDGEVRMYGLERIAGTYADAGTGNWTINNVFTANATINDINTTALFNDTWNTNITMFGWNTFTDVDLIANDQINVTWQIWVA